MDSKESAHLRSQTFHYTQAVAEVFYSVLQKRCPLDKELKQYFRIHNECGSRDRHYIREGCFSLFRWYGWLRRGMPGGLPAKPYESKKFCHALAAALWLEQSDDLPFFAHLLERANVDSKHMTSAADDIEEKKKKIGHYFKIRKLNILQLIPDWFIQVGPKDMELELLAEALQKRPPVWIRTRTKAQARVKDELNDKSVSFTDHPNCPNAIKILTTKFNTNSLACYEAGGFEIQDLGSQCIGLACQAEAGERWWDVCAGSGGKSLLLADEMQGQGKIVATDIRDEALKQLEKRVKRAHGTNISIADLADVHTDPECFDGVLVDAPCSCTGIWRRHPDLRWTTKEDICQTSASTQLEICEMAAKKVNMGGSLVYATCSLSVCENEDLVQIFLKGNKDFELKDFINPLDGELVHGILRIPFEPFDNDAMFIAKFCRIRNN